MCWIYIIVLVRNNVILHAENVEREREREGERKKRWLERDRDCEREREKAAGLS
jgi:hypothetical protein